MVIVLFCSFDFFGCFEVEDYFERILVFLGDVFVFFSVLFFIGNKKVWNFYGF